MAYVVRIRKNSTGEIRESIHDIEWTDSSEFWWTDGNMGCDCNRELEFERAGGREPDDDEDFACGTERFAVLSIRLLDGSLVYSATD